MRGEVCVGSQGEVRGAITDLGDPEVLPDLQVAEYVDPGWQVVKPSISLGSKSKKRTSSEVSMAPVGLRLELRLLHIHPGGDVAPQACAGPGVWVRGNCGGVVVVLVVGQRWVVG